jgi:hypothetical protein
MRILGSTLLLLCFFIFCNAQDSLITELAKIHSGTIVRNQSNFSGTNWNKIIEQSKKSDYVLIGEDHFTNEIPAFVAAITSSVRFDNFFGEIDPFSAKLIEQKIKSLNGAPFNEFIKNYSGTFSFFALQPEFDLLKQLLKSNTSFFGTDQIIAVADRLLCNNFQKVTKIPKAGLIYKTIEDSSKLYFENFLNGRSKPNGPPFYFLTGSFQKNLNDLSALKLSSEEIIFIERMRLSVRIYNEQNHHLRVQLMKNELMKVYDKWSGKKNLFKYGAFHLAKGESLLKVYDIGNMVNNIADSKFKSSLHVMIIGRSGTQGSPFKGFPDKAIDENSSELSPLKPFFKAMKGDDWHCFDMLPIREAIEKNKIVVNNITLNRIINGYDFIVIIPSVTPARFITVE